MGFGEKILGLFAPSGDTIRGTLEGAGSLAKDIRESITGEGVKLKQEELRVKVMALQQAIDIALVDVTKVEAKGNWFQRSWRPGLAWVIIGVIFVQYLLYPVLSWVWAWRGFPEIPAPTLAAADLWPIILGLIGYRSYEKQRGVV